MTENSEPTDLFGEPMRQLPDRRGRRKLRFPQEVYERVEFLAAIPTSQEDIAIIIGVSVPSLRKYFRPELSGTRSLSTERAGALVMLRDAAAKGNVSAIKALLAEIDKREASANFRRPDRPAETSRPEAPGKKAVARADAAAVIAADDKFAPRGAVRLATANGEAVASAPAD